MVLRQVGAAVLGLLLAHGGVALLAPGLYGAGWRLLWPIMVGSAMTFLVCLAVAITPENRRETRASATAFQSGLVVQVVYVTEPPHRGLPAGGARPPEGMPGIVPGEVVERKERE